MVRVILLEQFHDLIVVYRGTKEFVDLVLEDLWSDSSRNGEKLECLPKLVAALRRTLRDLVPQKLLNFFHLPQVLFA